VKIATRMKADGAELLVVHDGKPVELRHVVGMSIAFLTTKLKEERSKGRFGIGLKTLARIGSNLEVHLIGYKNVPDIPVLLVADPIRGNTFVGQLF
jgi:hypothetical protein